ncbi:alpha/beta hydrolase [Chryseobacterium rhizoplanae]|uniref:Alpha/beta hydrolase n=1 Tax=Chryseobacterium bernardetii TaxID=1241978 RepID=A0A3G6T9N6_9FLAO|nr:MULTISPECIES: alpha/beta hydrolase [Chryseobacterium]AZB24567.1 alpha/beta hydrolase [Chryseobacterium bernardetii]UCA58989.1 alpha/beta hydrolase [Chryseobacterium rhizoplanae]
MKKSLISIISLIFLLFTACKENKISLGNNISFNKEENLHYGNNPQQVIDLYMPDKTPSEEKEIFIIIHGGGWRGGNKSQLTFFTLSLMQRFPDHVFVNMNYRLASVVQYAIPNQTDDIKSVITYLKKRLNYQPKLILMGNSAGAHLSMLYAYHFDADKNVKAVINIVGPADLSDKSFKSYEEYSFVKKHLVDAKILPAKTSAINFASPVHWINTASSPTLSYYGKTDRVVPLSQSKILDSVLSKNNVIHESYEFNGGHLDWDKQPNNVLLIDRIEAFLKKADKK